MLEEIRNNFKRLVSLYESEKQRADELALNNTKLSEENSNYKMQINELNQQIETLRLQSAFLAQGDNALAKDSISKLIREIDRCIKLLEK